MRRLALLIAAVALLLGTPALALLPQTEVEPAPQATPTATQTIESRQESGADERIAQRIRGIFGELPAFAEVSVEVSEGVVTLDGKVPSDADIDRAEAIAARVAGVVTVENALERDVSLGENLQTLGGLSGKFADFGRMLPLLGLALLVALAIGAFGYLIAGLGGLWRRMAPNIFLAELIASAIRFIFVLGGIVVALDILGAGALLGAVLGGAGIIGLALGFALRDIVENYVASLMLSLRQPFRPNDWVVIDDKEGRVIRLTSRATILMTLDGNHLRIPNSAVFKAVILNYTRNPERRFDFELGIDADDDPTAARHLGVDVLRSLDFVLDHPEPQARVEAVGDSNIVIRFLGWINQEDTDWYKAKSRAIPAVKDALENAGFAIPEPIYRLRVDPRSAPVTTGTLQQAASAPSAPASPRSSGAAADVAPADEVAKMVAAERASEPDDSDLLDPRRPVE
jgi:small-conductance mechanosensitive channel